MLTLTRLRELVVYNKRTGLFRWRVNRGPKKIGDVAGYRRSDGYNSLMLDGINYLVGRLAVFYVTGVWPEHEVDHRDTDSGNDRWRNLRPATRSQNCANRNVTRANRLGVKGVAIDPTKKKKPYVAHMGLNGRKKHLGYFATLAEASSAYRRAAKEFHGEFSRSSSR